MNEVVQHFENAEEEIEQAEEKAPTGTAMMARDVLERIRKLRRRSENLAEEGA